MASLLVHCRWLNNSTLALAVLLTVLLTGLLLQGCPGPAPKSSGPRQRPPGSQLMEVAKATLSAEADRDRQRLIKEELDPYDDQVIGFSALRLNNKEQLLLTQLLEAARVVEELNMLQIHPQMLQFKKQALTEGTAEDKRLFMRNQGPWCLGSDDVRCSALRSMPPKEMGLSAWPPNFYAAELDKARSAKNSKELLSPFTLVRRQGKGYAAVPLVKDPVLGPKVQQLSKLLDQAADIATEPSLKKFLKGRARALISTDPFPYDNSDLDWIRLKGRWEVTVGPYETYRSPHQIKARFTMYIGLEDPDITAQLAAYRSNLQKMENKLARLVGTNLYKPRRMDPKTAIRAIEVIMAAGDAHRARGAVISYHLPNRGKALEKGLSKKVMMINHMRAFTPIFQKRASVALDAEHLDYLSEEASILNSTFHEFCHGFGAYDDMPIKTKKGKTTVAKALGDLAPLFEELKAESLALWFVAEDRRRGIITDDQLRQRYTSTLMHLLSVIQYDLKHTHPQMAALILGSLVKARAVRYREGTGHWSINYSKMRRSVKELAKQIATIQLTGDRDAAVKLFNTFLVQKAEGMQLTNILDRPRLKTIEAFMKAGIKGITILYKVTDLRPPKELMAKPKAKPKDKPKDKPKVKPKVKPKDKPKVKPKVKPAKEKSK